MNECKHMNKIVRGNGEVENGFKCCDCGEILPYVEKEKDEKNYN